MRIKTLVGVAATAVAALALAGPAQARSASPDRVTPFDLHITNPLPCDLGSDSTGANLFATCTAPAGQQWLYQLECRKNNPRYPLVFFTNGNTVTGSGTSRVSCAAFQAGVIGWKIALVN